MQQANTEIAQAQQPQAHSSTTDMVLDYKAMEQMNNLAQMMASGTSTVPKHLQGNPADCMAIVMQAAQWKMNPYSVAQKTHLVNGQLGYEAQLVNAVISSSKAIEGRFHYEYGGNWPNGQDASVRCGAMLAGESEIQWGEPLYIADVTTKNSPLWKTAPKQQASYLATKYWARMYAPAVILGVYSTDEFEPAPAPKERVINPAPANIKTDSQQLNDIVESVNSELSEAAEAIKNTLEGAGSSRAIKEIAASVKSEFEAGNISESDRKALLVVYAECMASVKKIEEQEKAASEE